VVTVPETRRMITDPLGRERRSERFLDLVERFRGCIPDIRMSAVTNVGTRCGRMRTLDPERTFGLLDNGRTNELAGNPLSTIYVLVPSDRLGPASRAMKCHSLVALVAFVVSRLLCTQSGLKCRHGETSCEAPCLSARGITW
jgi:hypothetical protein